MNNNLCKITLDKYLRPSFNISTHLVNYNEYGVLVLKSDLLLGVSLWRFNKEHKIYLHIRTGKYVVIDNKFIEPLSLK